MYYLQSRYYDPAIGRFINADTFATTDAEGFLSCNMFAYCENNPISGKDPTGEFVVAAMLTGALVGMGYQFMSDVITCLIVGDATFSLSSVGDYAAAAVSGALSAVPGAGFAKAAFDLVGSAILSEGVNSLISGKN